MDTIELKRLLAEITSGLKDKAGYLKSIDQRSPAYNKDYFDGMAMAYHQVLDFVKSSIENEEDLSLADFGLEDFDPIDILNYQPGEA